MYLSVQNVIWKWQSSGCTIADRIPFNDSQTALMYKNAKKKIDKGVAFPTCVSVNNTVCHFSPLASDDSVLVAKDIVKM